MASIILHNSPVPSAARHKFLTRNEKLTHLLRLSILPSASIYGEHFTAATDAKAADAGVYYIFFDKKPFFVGFDLFWDPAQNHQMLFSGPVWPRAFNIRIMVGFMGQRLLN